MDYSPYYFHRNVRPEYPEPEAGRVPRGRKKGISNVLLLVAVVVPVIAAIVAANAFTGGEVFSRLGSWLGGTDGAESYYVLIASKHSSEAEAVAYATIVRSSGGAGFVTQENEEYLVALATYSNREDAESVHDKNPGTEVMEVAAKYSALDKTDKSFASDAKKQFKAVYAEFETVQTEFAAGGISVSGAISALTPFRNDMLVLKNAAVENPDGDSLRIVDAYFSNAEAVVSGAYSPDEFLPVLRYAMCAMVFASR